MKNRTGLIASPPQQRPSGTPCDASVTSSSMRNSMQVATAFLQKGEDPQDGILILRRSKGMPTYPERWGGVSGVIEEGEASLAAAVREIFEETGIDSSDLEFARRGRTMTFIDGEHAFCIHPILFLLISSKSKILLNSENSKFEWIHPATILNGTIDQLPDGKHIVPHLCDVFNSVYISREVDHIIANAANDRMNGAAAVCRNALQLFESHVQDLIAEDPKRPTTLAGGLRPEALVAHLAAGLTHLAESRPTMASFWNNIHCLAQKVRELEDGWPLSPSTSPPDPRLQRLTRTLTILAQTHLRADERALRTTHHLNGIVEGANRVLIISRSSVIENSIIDVAKTREPVEGPLQVVVAEGRPLFEGMLTAAALAKAAPTGIEVTVITDAQIALYTQQVDAVLLGADAVLPDGSCVNKVGSFSAAVSAYLAVPERVPTYVVCASEKFVTLEQLALLDKVAAEEGVTPGGSPLESAPSARASAGVSCLALNGVDPRAPRNFAIEMKNPNELTHAISSKSTFVSDSDLRDIRSLPTLTNVKFDNVYFEVVPSMYITTIVTENGISRPGDAMQIATNLEEHLAG